ncbi:MAG: hypothetical protein IJ039_09445 [Clostridia bacterium]|nr:hypothetical protein [Clostridia bacterium]
MEYETLKKLEKVIQDELYIFGLIRLAYPKLHTLDYAQGYIEAMYKILAKLKENR